MKNQVETLILLDRNVVSVVKIANAGKPQKGIKEQSMLDRLQQIDKPFHSVTPLLSLIESEHGHKPSPAELLAGLGKETQALRTFFKRATTDSELLTQTASMFVESFTDMQEMREEGRAELLKQGAVLVAQKVAPHKRRAEEEKLKNISDALGLDGGEPALMLLMACLYGNDLVREVIKPHQLIKTQNGDKTYNVLSDINIIAFMGAIKTLARKSPIPLEIEFWTLDEGLDHVLKNVKFEQGRINAAGVIQLQIAYLPPLFPDLEEDKAVDLVARFSAPRKQA